MKITKDERTFIMNKVNELIHDDVTNINTTYDLCRYYKDDIIKAFKQTKEYKKLMDKINILVITDFDYDINTYAFNTKFIYVPCIRLYKYNHSIINNKFTFKESNINVNANIYYALSDEDKSLNLTNRIYTIDDTRLMKKVLEAQDLPSKMDKAPVIKNIINELVTEINTNSITLKDYKKEILDYIKKNYNND